jgi:protein-S-isoprenylcysteine O-methyltransferase Ste14
MRRFSAIAGSAAFFVAAPCVVAGLLPWLLTNGWAEPASTLAAIAPLCWLAIAGALVVLLEAFARFALDGLGTPAPIAPTRKLVIRGTYRHVRNPMYLAVLMLIFAQALLFSSWPVVVYGLVAGAAMASFVRLHEEPTLSGRYGAEYEAYRRAVPGWLPRLTPWKG